MGSGDKKGGVKNAEALDVDISMLAEADALAIRVPDASEVFDATGDSAESLDFHLKITSPQSSGYVELCQLTTLMVGTLTGGLETAEMVSYLSEKFFSHNKKATRVTTQWL